MATQNPTAKELWVEIFCELTGAIDKAFREKWKKYFDTKVHSGGHVA